MGSAHLKAQVTEARQAAQTRDTISSSKGAWRHQKQGKGFGSVPKSQAGPKGHREHTLLLRLLLQTRARHGFQRPRT